MREVIDYHCKEFSRIFKEHHDRQKIYDTALNFRTSLYFWNAVFRDAQRLVSYRLKSCTGTEELQDMARLQDFFIWFNDRYEEITEGHNDFLHDLDSNSSYVPASTLPKIG